MDIVRGILIVFAMITMSVCGVASTLTHWRMIDEVNKRLPPQDRIVAIGGPLMKRRNPIPEYRRFVPQGPLLRTQRRLMATFIVSLVVSLLGLGFGAGVVWVGGGMAAMWWYTFAADFRKPRSTR